LRDFHVDRSAFPITERYVFMNHAAVAPLPLPVTRTLESLVHEFGDCGIARYGEWMKRTGEVRSLFARLINGHPSEIAFVGNTSEGLSAVATGLQWKKGEAVLVPEPDFPANIYPWMNLERYGVKVHFIKRKAGRFGMEEVKKALVPGTRVLSVSSVDFASGFLCDLAGLGDLCQAEGLLFCVDAIQSLGAIPMDVRRFKIHFLAAGSHKWLLGPMGCGALFVSREVDSLLHPEQVGWKSVVDEENFFQVHFDLKTDARRFEPGTMNVAGIYGLGAALELLMEVGIEKIHKRVLHLNDLLYQGLQGRHIRISTPMGKGERSGIFSFIPPRDGHALFRSLTARNVMVSLRKDIIRLSPHFYNTEGDINRFFEALDAST